jgi:hypothetical protein
VRPSSRAIWTATPTNTGAIASWGLTQFSKAAGFETISFQGCDQISRRIINGPVGTEVSALHSWPLPRRGSVKSVVETSFLSILILKSHFVPGFPIKSMQFTIGRYLSFLRGSKISSSAFGTQGILPRSATYSRTKATHNPLPSQAIFLLQGARSSRRSVASGTTPQKVMPV